MCARGLFNREKMNATPMFNAYFLHKSYYETLYDDAHPCPNEEFHFDRTPALWPSRLAC